MKSIDSIWELNNLGEKVIEISIEKVDYFDADRIKETIDSFDYCVIKVPMNKTEFNFGLSGLGFTMIETQINISKRFKDFPFDDRLVRQIYPKAHLEYINNDKELDEILNKMTPNMFSTDRIYLDYHFAKGQSCERYKNWLRSEFEKGTSEISKIIYEGKHVGFGMGRELENGTSYGLLGGIFEDYQMEGLGLMTCSIGFINAHKINRPFKVMRTSISSNNTPVLQFYNYLDFKVDCMTYVFVKHNG